MHVVAIYDIGEDKEQLTRALAASLGKTLLEARSRLNAPGSGPFVVGLFNAEAGADVLAEKLRSSGFHTVVLGEDDIRRAGNDLEVRRFDFREKELCVESSKGESLAAVYSGVDLILRGTGITSSISTESTTQRKFDLTRAVLSSGLSVTKTTKTVREATNQEREGFFILFTREERPIIFREKGPLYDSLGPSRKPSRSANFAFVLAELRSRCSAARYDERLLSRSGQAALLGPSLDPEGHLVIATSLIAKVLRGK